jgi:hypothetical protein
MNKDQVGAIIQRVESGVDEFKRYLENKGENASGNAQAAKNQAAQSGRTRKRTATESQKNAAQQDMNQLKDSIDKLDKSTSRLRRRFNRAGNYLETKAEVQGVLDDAQGTNNLMTKGNYNAEAARLWAGLRTQINQLARAYSLTPLSV